MNFLHVCCQKCHKMLGISETLFSNEIICLACAPDAIKELEEKRRRANEYQAALSSTRS